MKNLDLVNDFEEVVEQLKAIRKEGQGLVVIVVEGEDDGSTKTATACNIEDMTYAAASLHAAVCRGWREVIDKSKGNPAMRSIANLALDGLSAEYADSEQAELGNDRKSSISVDDFLSK